MEIKDPKLIADIYEGIRKILLANHGLKESHLLCDSVLTFQLPSERWVKICVELQPSEEEYCAEEQAQLEASRNWKCPHGLKSAEYCATCEDWMNGDGG